MDNTSAVAPFSGKPHFKILFSLVNGAFWVVSLGMGYVALRLGHISYKMALVWGVPSLLFGIMGLLPVIFYLFLKLNLRSPLFTLANRYCIGLYFPFILYLGETFGFDKISLIRELVSYNNKYVFKKYRGKLRADQIIVLVPHCLQVRDCDHRVTVDIEKCAMCGRCPITHLVGISHRFGVKIFTATGGTLARRIVKETKPRAIIAVACERDLYSGLRDTFPLPVIGVFNETPSGPCIDTTVNTAQISIALESLLQSTPQSNSKNV
ncbi:DUF116 domain-containing protein [Chrysiogenes arsenatis]|uniref:DUF116 domain-containing protein n=1 Tax=Chrysiogenes arsenatis TaxID=309797 RepID=UPI00041E3C07|nr:DUF116 domain-containing protein [Chrysiogenes arsenatis]